MRKPSIAHGSGSEVDKGQAILATTGASNLSATRRLPEEEVRWGIWRTETSGFARIWASNPPWLKIVADWLISTWKWG